MFSCAAKNIIRNSLVRKFLRNQRVTARGIVSAQNFLCQQHIAKVQDDIIVESAFAPLKYPDLTIDQYVWSDLNKWSNKTALVSQTSGEKCSVSWFDFKVDGITDRSVSYGQLRDLCRVLAIRLQSAFHLIYGDTIAVCLPNSIEFPIVCLAGSEAGTIITTVNPIYTSGELK